MTGRDAGVEMVRAARSAWPAGAERRGWRAIARPRGLEASRVRILACLPLCAWPRPWRVRMILVLAPCLAQLVDGPQFVVRGWHVCSSRS